MFAKIGGKIETHVPGFDRITGGGLIRSSTIGVVGAADGSKELLVRQICWNLLNDGGKVLYFTVDHSADELRYDMAAYGWDVKPFERARKLRLVDIFSDAAEKMDRHVKQVFDEKEAGTPSFQGGFYDFSLFYKEGIRFLPPTGILQGASRVVVIDSLSPLFSTRPQEVFPFLHTLKFATRIAKATGIGIMHGDVHEKNIEETLKSIADGLIAVTRSNERFSDSSIIEIVKYPGEFERGVFPIEIDSTGIKIIPISLSDLFNASKLT